MVLFKRLIVDVGGYETMKGSKGFTLTELAAGLLIAAIAVGAVLPGWACMPNFIKAREKSKEAEVKSNIHTIQIGLERYAVDTGGVYPLILYGGDERDTFATYKSYVKYPPIDEPDYVKPWEQEGHHGDIDVLLEFGYMKQYPSNPFVRTRDAATYVRIITNPGANGFEPLEIPIARVNIWARPRERSREYIRREVGGKSGTLMWDISEGQRHPPWPIIVVPDPEPGEIGYVNPLPGSEFRNQKGFRDDYQFWLTPGNFYYYALFDGVGCYSSFVDVTGEGIGNIEYPIMGAVIGFKLCGYGTLWNPGLDYYNLYGDFPERSLFTVNNPPETNESILDIFVGPDGRCDGVIIVVESAVRAQYRYQ
jgi:type II secretory pathway pseudopilin PulG